MMKHLKEIGGFFDLSLPNNDGSEYHRSALALNTGRNAFLYILKSKEVSKVYLPFYICDSVLSIIEKCSVDVEFYQLNENLEPTHDFILQENEYLYYVNYFGTNQHNVQMVLKKYNQVIIDNTQAFFQMPFGNEPTIYSARKFFGVADGSYLYTDTLLKDDLDNDYSFDRYEHLLKRVEFPANETYKKFLENEEKLNNLPMKKMSRLTRLFLQNIDYASAKYVRECNFRFLHSQLMFLNKLTIKTDQLNGPMVYPLLHEIEGLREFLIENKVYVPTYWEDVFKRVNPNNFEYKLVNFLIPIPIDQRYNSGDLSRIIKLIEKYIN